MSLSEQVEHAMLDAVQYLATVLEWEVVEAPTHRTLIVRGWNKDDTTRQAIARYLVGLRACAMDAALNIKALLEDTADDRLEILQNVIAIVGEDNSEDTKEKQSQKTTEGNPWIAEGLWHLCLTISTHGIPEIHPPGRIIALNPAHVIAKDHGLDIAAIYQSEDSIGLALVETKAYESRVNQAISDAVRYFREVNDGIHAVRIRDTVATMRNALPPEVNAGISASFWKHTRAYLPNPHYDMAYEVDWTLKRPALESLRVAGVDTVWVIPHGIAGFTGFFDAIADEMRAFARELVNV